MPLTVGQLMESVSLFELFVVAAAMILCRVHPDTPHLVSVGWVHMQGILFARESMLHTLRASKMQRVLHTAVSAHARENWGEGSWTCR